MRKRVELPDDTLWPVYDPDAAYAVRYGSGTYDQINEVLDYAHAYWHLTQHPAGIEAAVNKLRALRRAIAKDKP